MRRVRHTDRRKTHFTLPLYKDKNDTNVSFDIDTIAKPGRWERRKLPSKKQRNPALNALSRSHSRMTRQLRQGQQQQAVDCSKVTCPSLDSCFKRSFKPGTCCPLCVHEGCKCAEGAELNACIQNGFKRGILPIGQGFKACGWNIAKHFNLSF